MYIKKGSKSANTKALKEKHPKGFVVPETEIRDLVANLRIGEAHDVALCLLVIGEAVKAIVEDKTGNRELNLRLIEHIANKEKCRPVQRIIEAILAAVEQGADGIYAACLTITRFLEFAFEYQPDASLAEHQYKNELSKIRRATQTSK